MAKFPIALLGRVISSVAAGMAPTMPPAPVPQPKQKKPIFLHPEQQPWPEKQARAMRVERLIGVHPKYRNRQSDYSAADAAAWEKAEKEIT